jgi:23S rRNA G2069 N7-methylase RlmK/C1962 C5-methylase RlmI
MECYVSLPSHTQLQFFQHQRLANGHIRRGKETDIYHWQLNLTPKESNRLRQVSYERQLERGTSRPGYAGLTVERFGDAEVFQPAAVKVQTEQEVINQE